MRRLALPLGVRVVSGWVQSAHSEKTYLKCVKTDMWSCFISMSLRTHIRRGSMADLINLLEYCSLAQMPRLSCNMVTSFEILYMLSWRMACCGRLG